MLIIVGSGSGKTNALLKKCEVVEIRHLNDSKAFTEYFQCVVHVYNNIDDYNPSRKKKGLIVFDDMIPDIMTNEKFRAIIKELFARCRKLNISLVFITECYFSLPKEVRLNSTSTLFNNEDSQQMRVTKYCY